VKENGLNIISLKEFDKEVHEESVVFVIVDKKVVQDSEEVREVLKEFLDVFLFELLDVYRLCVAFKMS
jgi:hypothetical protein